MRHVRRHSSPRCLVLAGSLLLATAAMAQVGPAAIVGTWLTEPGDKGGRAHVRVTRQGDQLVGRIVHLEEPNFPPDHQRAGRPKVDLENPDPELRERPIVGLQILSGFTYAGDGKWTGGTIYDPANGKTYKAQITMETRDRLDLRGYIGVPLLGRTTTWKRVE